MVDSAAKGVAGAEQEAFVTSYQLDHYLIAIRYGETDGSQPLVADFNVDVRPFEATQVTEELAVVGDDGLDHIELETCHIVF